MNLRTGISTGTLSSAPDGQIINHVLSFVASCAKDWGSNTEKYASNENDLTNEFCQVLNRTKPPEYSYSFHHQNLEDPTKGTSTDFAAFKNVNSVLTALSSGGRTALVKFEAKRLSSGLSANREKEYVIGDYSDKQKPKNSGAIERFKNETHGKDVSNAAILAYVQSNTFDHWHQKINQWINEEIADSSDSSLTGKWKNSDLLVQFEQKELLVRFTSESERLTQENINIAHIWVNLCRN